MIYDLKVMNKVFNAWYTFLLSSKLERQICLPPPPAFSTADLEENYNTISENYCDQTLMTKAFVCLRRYAHLKK